MGYPREALVALAEAVRALHQAAQPLPAVREALPVLAQMLGATEAAVEEALSGDLRPAAPCLWMGSWAPAARRVAEVAAAVGWEIYCPIGRSDVLSVALQQGAEALGLSFRRAGGFGTQETRLLTLFLEHVTMATGGAGAGPGGAGRADGEWALRVSAVGELGPVGPELVLVWHRYWPEGGAATPVALQRWVAAQVARRRSAGVGDPGPAWCVAQPWGRLHLQLEWVAGGAAVLRGWEERGAADFRRLRARGLTARECEVVFWLAQGKRDAEIAVILAAAPKTIGKHVEHVLVKLGAESRAAASAAAQAWLEDGAGRAGI